MRASSAFRLLWVEWLSHSHVVNSLGSVPCGLLQCAARWTEVKQGASDDQAGAGGARRGRLDIYCWLPRLKRRRRIYSTTALALRLVERWQRQAGRAASPEKCDRAWYLVFRQADGGELCRPGQYRLSVAFLEFGSDCSADRLRL